MDKKEEMLFKLQGEIDKKCSEIKQEKAKAMWEKLFLLTCVLFIVLPVVLIFAGVNLLAVLMPVAVYLSICIFIFSPIILNNKKFGGIMV